MEKKCSLEDTFPLLVNQWAHCKQQTSRHAEDMDWLWITKKTRQCHKDSNLRSEDEADISRQLMMAKSIDKQQLCIKKTQDNLFEHYKWLLPEKAKRN